MIVSGHPIIGARLEKGDQVCAHDALISALFDVSNGVGEGVT
tara:strand:- start:696 stop:821 length:126 start_codon:yes stop_codon:yes gene_type:complete